jgi:hypothetical protein
VTLPVQRVEEGNGLKKEKKIVKLQQSKIIIACTILTVSKKFRQIKALSLPESFCPDPFRRPK